MSNCLFKILCNLCHLVKTYFIPLQLENIIGKLKAEKYGSRILEQVNTYANSTQPEDAKEDQDIENRASKRLKSKKHLVLVESSDDES